MLIQFNNKLKDYLNEIKTKLPPKLCNGYKVTIFDTTPGIQLIHILETGKTDPNRNH